MVGFAASTIELLTCTSEFTIENSVTSPARAHATEGKRVFTGRVPTILNMAILPRCACVPALPSIFPAPETLGDRAWFQSGDAPTFAAMIEIANKTLRQEEVMCEASAEANALVGGWCRGAALKRWP